MRVRTPVENCGLKTKLLERILKYRNNLKGIEKGWEGACPFDSLTRAKNQELLSLDFLYFFYLFI